MTFGEKFRMKQSCQRKSLKIKRISWQEWQEVDNKAWLINLDIQTPLHFFSHVLLAVTQGALQAPDVPRESNQATQYVIMVRAILMIRIHFFNTSSRYDIH